MDIAPGLGVSYCHLPPLVSIFGFEGHNVAKIRSVVVPLLYRLMTKYKIINVMWQIFVKHTSKAWVSLV